MKKYFYSHKVTHFLDQNRNVCYLCRWALERIVVQNDALEVSEIAVAYWNCCDLVTGKIKPDQRQFGQLCKPMNTEMTQHIYTKTSLISFRCRCLRFWPEGRRTRWFLRMLRSRRASSWPICGGSVWISLQLTSLKRERERDNWWVMCMSESKCEDDCRARERALVHTPVRWAVWVCPDPPAAIPACYCRRSELWVADGTDERGVWTTGSDCREKTRTKRIRNRRLQWLDLRKYESGTFTWITWKGQCSY